MKKRTAQSLGLGLNNGALPLNPTVSESKQDWEVGSGAKAILQKDNRVNILCGIGTGMVVAQTWGENAQANAQRIVTAVNCFDEMLEALKDLVDTVSEITTTTIIRADLINDMIASKEKALTAIAKANNSK